MIQGTTRIEFSIVALLLLLSLPISANAKPLTAEAVSERLGLAEPRVGDFDGLQLDAAHLAAREGSSGGDEDSESMRIEEERSGNRVDDGTHNSCHYARGSTLIMHLFIDHRWGSWDESERDEAAAKAEVAKEFYLEQAPEGANLSFDNEGTLNYFYVIAYVDDELYQHGWDEVDAALTNLGIVDHDGDGELVDDYTHALQFWNGGYDNVILVVQVANTGGGAWASSLMSACFMDWDDSGNVWAHEWGHMFGACDEYIRDGGCHGEVDCDLCIRSHYLGQEYLNENCELPTCDQDVDCLMKHNHLEFCEYTIPQISWADDDENGQLNWTERITDGLHWDIMEIWDNGFITHNTTTHSFAASVSNPNWTVFGLRPPGGTDYDLHLFSDNNLFYPLASSSNTGSTVEFIVADYSRSRPGIEHLQVENLSGPYNYYDIVWDGNGQSLHADGIEREFAWGANGVVQIWDLPLNAGETVSFTLDPGAGIDMGMALFWSYGDYYFAGRHVALWQEDAVGAGAAETYSYSVSSGGTYGFVVWSNNAAAGNYTIRVGPGPTILSEEVPVSSSADLQLYQYLALPGYWAGVAARPPSWIDPSLGLYDDENFTDEQASSDEPEGELELLAVQYASIDWDFLRISKSGFGAIRTEWEQSSDLLTGYEAGSWTSSHVVKMWDVALQAGETYVFREYHPFYPVARLDTGLYLFSPGNGEAQGKPDAVAVSDDQPASAGGEWFTHTAASSGDHGLALVMNNESDDSYSLWWGPYRGLAHGDAHSLEHEVIFGGTAVIASDWVVWGARPNGDRQVDMWLMNDSAYTTSSGYSLGVDGVNFIVADRNHLPDLDVLYPRFRVSGTPGPSVYAYEGGDGESIPFGDSMETLELEWPEGAVAVAYDIFINGSIIIPREVVIQVEILSGGMDLGLALFETDNPGGESIQTLADAQVLTDLNGPGGTETLSYTSYFTDDYGVVIFNQNASGGSYRIRTYDPTVVSVDEGGGLPTKLSLSVDRNPLSRRSEVAFSLPTDSQVSIQVFDVSGRLLRTLASGNHPAGNHVVQWNGQSENGSPCSAGVYFIRMDTGSETRVSKVVKLGNAR